MTIYPMILVLLLPSQVKPKPDTPEDRARRAAIVDRIMAEPGVVRIKIEKPAVEEDPAVAEAAQRANDLARARAQALEARARAQIQVATREVDAKGRVVTRTMTFEPPGQAKPDGEIDPPEPVMPIGFRLNDAVLERENYDRWIFGDGVDEEGRRIRLQSLLSEKISVVMKDRDINMAQLQKLRLAGSGDIKRFLDRAEERRPEFEVARKTYQTGRLLLRELQPLSAEFQEGPFGADSFFAKTLNKIESDAKASTKDKR